MINMTVKPSALMKSYEVRLRHYQYDREIISCDEVLQGEMTLLSI